MTKTTRTAPGHDGHAKRCKCLACNKARKTATAHPRNAAATRGPRSAKKEAEEDEQLAKQENYQLLKLLDKDE